MIHRRLLGVFVAIAFIIATGIVGYMAIEGWSPFDALYMTVITIASVGYMEVHPLSFNGRAFTMVLILCGCGTLIYGLSVLTAYVVEGDLTDALRRRKMKNKIAALSQHFLVCGIGSTGKYLLEELVRMKRSFVVIDKDPEKVRQLADRGILCIEGDATHDATLEEANIGGARGIVTALQSDADNLLVVVSARGLNPALKIISKAVDEESERKLRQVGADRVVLPNYIGGLRMASEMIRPSVVSFLDIMLRSKDATIRVEEIGIPAHSPFCGMTFAETGLPDVEGVTIVAVKGADDAYLFNPARHRRLTAGDVVIAMGLVERITPLKERAEGHH
jgi:voltage-gated potassium channel